jgi:hypothetical protein
MDVDTVHLIVLGVILGFSIVTWWMVLGMDIRRKQ